VQKDWKNYWTQNDVVLEQAQRNEQRFPKDQEALRHLYEAYVSVGDSWTKNEPAKALDLYRNSMVYAERAAALDPASPKPVYGIYNAQIKSAYVIEQQSDRAAAKAAYEAALATIDRVLSMTPQESYYQASRDHVLARLDIVEKGLPPPDFR
jgi:hypothetical protein